jgi:type II secretory pathway pseudopilin PulG
MHIGFRQGFSFLDMMMYLSIMALSYHYAIPCYKQLIGKMRAQELIKVAQQAQLQINEYALLQGELPEDLDLSEFTTESIKELSWHGDLLEISFKSGNSQESTLLLKPLFENFSLKWDCDFEGQTTLKTYVCYALT